MTPDTQASACVIARRQRRSNLKLAVAPKLDCFTPFAMTPQKTNQIASLMFAMTPQGQRHRPRTVSLREGNDEAISNQRRPQTRLLHSVRNDTPRATPPPSNRVIARRKRRSNLKPAAAPNQIASLPFAKTPKNHPRLLTLFAMTPQGQRHRPRIVSLREGNDEAISS
jgi:hypothetical protein